MGVTDVDPFIMGMTQAGGQAMPLAAAAAAILIAASSNNLIKGIYAYAASDRRTGLMSLLLLVGAGGGGPCAAGVGDALSLALGGRGLRFEMRACIRPSGVCSMARYGSGPAHLAARRAAASWRSP